MKIIDDGYHLNQLKEYYKEHGYRIQEINPFGIRNKLDMGKGLINDIIGLWTKDKIYIAKGTTDPGIYYTENPMNKEGTLHLCLGHHQKMYRVKKHRDQYKALCNDWTCKKQRVWRDKDKNFIYSKNDKPDLGHFGANLHRMGGRDKYEKIGKYSAGCQVIESKSDFDEYMNIVMNSKMYKGTKLITYFDYMLFDINEVNSLYHIIYC